MNKEKVNLDSIKLVGITARTNNKNEMNPGTAKIAQTAGSYWSQQIANQFSVRKNPGVTYAVYTDYESDEHGDYTYFLGEEVESFEEQDNAEFKQLVVPASAYQKFTTSVGKMPDIVINAWQAIWQMQPTDLHGTRRYLTDFEIYDQRAIDPDNSIVDIYIGIN